jgi:hypothetical protein
MAWVRPKLSFLREAVGNPSAKSRNNNKKAHRESESCIIVSREEREQEFEGEEGRRAGALGLGTDVIACLR